MMYFLDTNICIFFLNDTFRHIREKLGSLPREDINISSIVAAELYYGAEKSKCRDYNFARYSHFISLYNTVPFSHAASRIYGRVRAALEAKGQPIGGNDLMIAASALSAGAVLVTNNVKEFSRVDNLVIEDWTNPLKREGSPL